MKFSAFLFALAGTICSATPNVRREKETVDCGLIYDLSVFPPQAKEDAGCACVTSLTENEIQNQKTKVLGSDESHQNKVMNCNGCGACSNCRDIEIYYRSSQVMGSDITSQLFDFECALAYYFTELQTGSPALGREAARSCLASNTDLILEGGLTEDCLDCWVDAVQCTPQQCLGPDACGPILDYILEQGGGFNGEIPVGLQSSFGACLLCDAVKCSPAFVSCAGASRRTIGFESEILKPIADLLGQKVCERAKEDNVCGLGE